MVAHAVDLELDETCVLEIKCGDRCFEIEAIVRWIPAEPEALIGVEISGLDAALMKRIERVIEDSKQGKVANHAGRTGSLVHQFKGLPLVKLMTLARNGEYNERVALERMYGKSVWDSLLRNPKITTPEVARIARKGTVPRGILDKILDNKSWCRNAAVRRALLANTKLSTDGAAKLLRVTPKSELRLIPQQSAYSLQVRQMAKKLFTGG